MNGIVYLNGSYTEASEAKISVFDRGILFADSVYEVIPVYKGRLFRLERHLRRLSASLASARITEPNLDWQALFNELIKLNGGGDLQIYLQITRGDQGFRKHDIPANLAPTIIAFTLHVPYPTVIEKQQGLRARLLDDIRWLRCDIKSTAMLANVLLNDEALANNANTALLARDGFLTEGAASNIFLVDANGEISTPPLTNLCLPGITREITIELINKLGWTLHEKNIPSEAAFTAQEIWITSTTKEIYPVTSLNEQKVGTGVGGDYWRQVNEQYQQLVETIYD